MDIEALIAEVDALPPRAALAREVGRLRRDELDGSLAIAGTPLARGEVTALVDRGLAIGGHPYAAYVRAHSLAAAAAWVWSQRPYAHGDPRPLLTIEDVRRIHGLTVAGEDEARPGMWRMAVVAPRHDVVSPPPWMVPAQAAALVERVRARPAPGQLVFWLADTLARFARIRPFSAGNGRTGRLVGSLLLRRLDAPPLAIPREEARTFTRALVAAEAGDARTLAATVERALGEGCRRLLAAGGDAPLVPLRSVAGDDYPALIKAAQRGRLRTVTRAHRIYTTAEWIAAYVGSRSANPPPF